ncbi:MAG: glycosyltransferase family 2 protein [Lachnospiraceae bacterium]|nr:glycosyltransferase family 2 protein [Lachnospiraceae bacterium]
MTKLITFIIPAYNVELFLNRCLDSFVCPEVMKQMEVIIVDDGSTDRTGEIADWYVQQYPQLFRVVHKENGGHGSTINTGSQIAEGKYFKVIDSDDWVITKHLPRFVKALETCQADVVLTPFHLIDMTSGKKTARTMDLKGKKRCFTLEEVMKQMPAFESCCVFHGIAYRTDFYREQQHMLTEHVFYEDQEYSAVPFCSAASIAAYPIFLYQYMVGNSQQSIAYDSQAKRIDHLETVIKSLIQYDSQSAALSKTAKEYLRYKIQSMVLIYYATACIYEKDKKKGRGLVRRFDQELIKLLPVVRARVKKRYWMYRIMNWLRVTPCQYQRMIESKGYTKWKLHGRKRGNI